jgi:N-acetylmuramoyl-L-alanine amidase
MERLILFFSLSNGWHAGDGSGEGNRASIGVEIAQSTSDNLAVRNASLENGARLAARLLKGYNFGTDRLRKHQDWSGKFCPHDILERYGWPAFVNLVQQKLNSGDY